MGLNSGRRADISFARRCCWECGSRTFFFSSDPGNIGTAKSPSPLTDCIHLFQNACVPATAGRRRFQKESSVLCGCARFQNDANLSPASGSGTRFQKLVASRLVRSDTPTSARCLNDDIVNVMYRRNLGINSNGQASEPKSIWVKISVHTVRNLGEVTPNLTINFDGQMVHYTFLEQWTKSHPSRGELCAGSRN